MREKTYKVYLIDELDESAQENAHSNYCNCAEYAWASENEETLKAFCELFPISATNWEYGYRYSIDYKTNVDAGIDALRDLRLRSYIVNNYIQYLETPKTYYLKNIGASGNKTRKSKISFSICCPFTGYYMDNEILGPIISFVQNPHGEYRGYCFSELLGFCLQQWIITCDKDYSAYYEIESFLETSRANEWEYTENGEMI